MKLTGVATLLLALATPARGQVRASVDRSGLEGSIAGRVCVDLDGDGRCAPDEPGQAGVRLVLASGQEVRTDATGRYAVSALHARVPLPGAGGHFTRGRHRLRLDPGTLPAGLFAPVDRATLELPMAGVALQDFALRPLDSQGAPSLRREDGGRAPAVGWSPEGLTFELTGATEPDAQVTLAGAPVALDSQGHYRAEVPVKKGLNAVELRIARANGQLELYTQRIEVVEREDGLLFVPAEPERWGRILLPGPRDAVATGRTSLTFELPPGTSIQLGDTRAEVGRDGRSVLPIQLGFGSNTLRLSLQVPEEETRELSLEVSGALRPFAVGLLDLEVGWDLRENRLRLEGQGSAHGELRWEAWTLQAELSLDHSDVQSVRTHGPLTLLTPRRPERFERALDPEWTPFLPGSQAAVLTPNPAEGRLRLLVEHAGGSSAGFGTHRLQLDGTELGRYHRPMFGLFGDAALPLAPGVEVTGRVGADLGLVDPTRGLATRRIHEEHRATGGSVFHLRQGGLAEGSERVRVEVRDGISGLPLAEQHLVRGRDYELDARSGRLLLARALSFIAVAPELTSLPLVGQPEPVLVVDYAALEPWSQPGRALAGELGAKVLGGSLGLGGVVEDAGHRMLRAHARIPVGTLSLLLEGARSWGSAWTPGAFVRSDDGGLTPRALETATLAGGEALTARLKGETFGSGGRLDASFRVRTPGFSDGAHADRLRFRQAALRFEQPLGDLSLAILADDREGQVTGGRYADAPYRGRSLGLGLGWEHEAWTLKLEGRDESLAVESFEGGRTALGAVARYRLHESLALTAAHRQVVASRGMGPGAIDDTHASVGADVELEPGTRLGVRAGWGPVLGPLAWLEGERRQGSETFYGSVSSDVDGPDVGTLRSVSGARTELGDGSSVFIEDVAAHDALSIRASRAVGLYQRLGSGWDVFLRYEQGVRDPLGVTSPLTRSAGSAGASFVSEWLRLQARVELWQQGALGDQDGAGEARQGLAALAGELRLSPVWTLAGRLHASDSTLEGLRAGRFVEGHLGLAWHPGPWMIAGRYTVSYERPPPERLSTRARMLQVVSLLPALQLGDRVQLSGGLHGGRASDGAEADLVLSGSVRPSVRVVGDLELAAELAARSSAPDDGELWAARGEVALRMGLRGRMALGYTAFGFSGLGLDAEEAQGSRVYLRGELAW